MKLISPQLRDPSKLNHHVAILGPWLIFFGVAGAAAIIFSVVSTQGSGVSSGFTQSLFYCDNNNNIRYQYSDDSFADRSPYWDSDLFLSVTMGFHGLSYSEAKIIDILFDLVCGRGSQILVGLLTYPILRRALLRSMEIQNLSLEMLVPFLMERISFNTLWAMVTNIRTVKREEPTSERQSAKSGVRVDWRIILTILVGSYILAMPTFLSAMTSYQALGAPFIPTDEPSSSYMSTENLSIPDFYVSDLTPLGWPKLFPLYNKTSDPQVFATLIGYSDGYWQATNLWASNWPVEPIRNTTDPNELEVMLLEAESIFNRTRESLPQRQNVTDPSDPPLWSFELWPHNATWEPSGGHRLPLENIRKNVSYLTSSIVIMNTTYEPHEHITVNPNLFEGHPAPSTSFWYGDNKTADGTTLAAMGKCLPSEDYIWGFSSLMLFTFCMLTLVIVLYLIALHYDAYFNSMADRYKLGISPYRDILDLAGELRTHYGEAEAESMSATALDDAMQENPTMVGVETSNLLKSRAAIRERGKRVPRLPTWSSLRRSSTVAESSNTDSEQSLMAMGLKPGENEVEMGKLPAKVVTREAY